MGKQLARHCYNCVHCIRNFAYEECGIKTVNKYIYNGNIAKECDHYEQISEVQNG